VKTIVVMRHSKAEHTGPTDFDRTLSERGHVDATVVGEWLAALEITPDLALVSGATRTVQTWEDVAAGAGWDLDLAEYDEALYEAGTTTALDLIRDTSEEIGCLMVIGHNPTIANLAELLDDGAGEQSDELVLGYPTSAVAVFSYDGEWSDLDEAGATVVAFRPGARV